MQTMDSEIKNEVFVDEYTGGLVGPSLGFAATVKDGGYIHCVVPPGCWGPMITPEFRGGHEVTRPVGVEGAKVGDAIAITIESMRVLSLATSSGTMVTNKAAFGDDPFVDKKCPGCGTPWPASRVEGTGESSVRCVKCGTVVNPFGFEEGYTIVFDHDSQVGLTVDATTAHDFAQRAREIAALPSNARQHPILICPVKIDGGGIYIGDCHANQGDGELALHTTDITAEARVRVNIIKNLPVDGPILLPVAEDLPFITRPFSKEELEAGERLAQHYNVKLQRNAGPVQFIGTGPTLNEATDNAMQRAADVLQMTLAEVRNRCTITGGVEIGRLPGVVQLNMLVPMDKLDALGIGPYVRQQYGL